MKRIYVINIIIQLLWLAACVVLGLWISRLAFGQLSQPWYSIVSGLVTLVTYIILGVISSIIKAAKDPDVIAASDLKMSVKKYHCFQQLFEEYNTMMDKYCANPAVVEDKINDLFKNARVCNIDEWINFERFKYAQIAQANPELKVASELRMTLKRFNHYKKLSDEYQAFMVEHGTQSAASEKKFVEIFKQIGNPTEWRRYSDYSLKKSQERSYARFQEILGYNPYDE